MDNKGQIYMTQWNIRLNNGEKIPAIGLGVFMGSTTCSIKRLVKEALVVGYRHIGTAAVCQYKSRIGETVRESGIPREEFVISSKFCLQKYSYETAKKAIDRSLQNFGLDYMDIYLLHQPCNFLDQPGNSDDDIAGAWEALEDAVREGKIKSIGLSNHGVKHWQRLLPVIKIQPAVNQVKCNPFFQQKKLRSFLEAYGTRLQACSPFGGSDARMMAHPVLEEIGSHYGKQVGQVILRFHVQEGIIVLPGSVNPEQLRTNLEIFDFSLTDSDMAAIKVLNTERGSACVMKSAVRG